MMRGSLFLDHALVSQNTGNRVMLRKEMIALAAALGSMAVPQAASAGFHCYGEGAVVGSARCAGVGLGLQSPRWYYRDSYPYYIYPETPHAASADFVGGCHLVKRPVLAYARRAAVRLTGLAILVVSRTRCGVERRTAEPGPKHLCDPGPGSAAHRVAH
jgi:hypothetical protein